MERDGGREVLIYLKFFFSILSLSLCFLHNAYLDVQRLNVWVCLSVVFNIECKFCEVRNYYCLIFCVSKCLCLA